MTKVSVIVPVYKVPEQYLRQCIESLIAQTMQEMEILLVDDGSPDACGSICDSYAKNDPRIRVIHKQNGGLSAARNTGYQEAVGEYITFIDGDDWVEPEMCQVMYDVAKKDDVDLVVCGISKDYAHKRIPYTYYMEEGKVYRDQECKQLQVQLLMYNANMGAAYAKLIRRSLLQAHDIQHDPVLSQGAEGLEFNFRFFEHLHSAAFVNRHFYHYIYNENSISASHSEKNHDLVIRCFESIDRLIHSSDNKDELIPWFNNRLMYVIVTTAISGYFHPDNREPYQERKRKFQEYLKRPIISKALRYGHTEDISFQRRAIILMIRLRMFWMLNIMGKIRKWYKSHR